MTGIEPVIFCILYTMYILFAFGCFYVATYVLLLRNSGSKSPLFRFPTQCAAKLRYGANALAFECAPFVPLCGIGGAHPFAITIPLTMRSYIGDGYILRIYYTNPVNLTPVKYHGGRNYTIHTHTPSTTPASTTPTNHARTLSLVSGLVTPPLPYRSGGVSRRPSPPLPPGFLPPGLFASLRAPADLYRQ